MPRLSSENTTEPSNALKKPSTSIPGVIQPANINSSAFITKLNIPIVKIFIGRVIICITGLTNALINAMITHASIAAHILLTFIPGINQAVKIKASAKHIHLTRIIFTPYLFTIIYSHSNIIR